MTIRSLGIASVVAILTSVPVPAAAQVWAPAARVGGVTYIVQVIDNAGHRLDDGTEIHDGKSTNVGIGAQVDYALTDRFSVAASLPLVMSLYRGPGPTPVLPASPQDTCRCWHGNLQDFVGTARFSLFDRRRSFAVTPSVAVVVPSHDYQYYGEAVPGRHLREVLSGVDAGLWLDRLVPRLFVTGHYQYGWVEQVLDVPNNRSLMGLEGGYALTRRLVVRGVIAAQRTHGGLRFPQDVVGNPDFRAQHDRLLRDNYVHAGAGVSYRWRSVEIFGSWLDYVSGSNTHMGQVFTAAVTVPFERAAPRPKSR